MRRLGMACILLFTAAAVAAQQAPPAPVLLYVHEEVVRPSMVSDYEKTTREFIAMLRTAGIPFHFITVAADDFHYYFVTPMKSFGDIDKITQTFMVDLPQKVAKEKLTDIMRRGGATMEMTREWVVIRRDDLSYKPAKPRLKESEATHFQYDFYYLKPGQEDLVDQIANDWKAAFAAANISDGFTVFQAAIGGDLPMIAVVTDGKSHADLAVEAAKNMEALGSKGQDLAAKTMSIVRKFESKVGQLRPDLSNPAPQAKPAN